MSSDLSTPINYNTVYKFGRAQKKQADQMLMRVLRLVKCVFLLFLLSTSTFLALSLFQLNFLTAELAI